MEDLVQLVVDTREQNPLTFPPDVLVHHRALAVGDYAPASLLGAFAIERKSHEDLAACCGADRDRFRDQVERLSKLPLGGHLVIEPTIGHILTGDVRSRISPRAIVQTLLSWSAELRVPVWFTGNRLYAASAVLGLCRHAVRHFESHGAVGEEPQGERALALPGAMPPSGVNG